MLVTTILYLLLTFASEIQRRVDFMYNNSDYGNILMIIYLSSLRRALAAGRSLVTPRSKALKAFGKEVMWITYAQVSYLSTVIKSAILCISLATFYSLTNVSWVFQRRRSKRNETPDQPGSSVDHPDFMDVLRFY